MKHIEFEKFVKSIEGSLSLAEKQEVSTHLTGCAECASKMAKLQYFLSYAQSTNSASVPQAVTANLLNIYQPKKIRQRKDSIGKRLLAVLAFDDWQIALNERLVFSDTRQLLYKTDQFDIDLRLHFVGDKCQVSGQIFPDAANLKIELFCGEFIENVRLNRHSEFNFPSIEKGIYGLRISSEEFLVEIDGLSLIPS